jgi:MoxR-like ATPase
MLLRVSRALAASNGRDYVIPDDVKKLVVPVMAHRIILSADAAMNGRTAKAVLADLMAEVPVPVRGKA